ncbi:hypothetical protein QL285_009848 [Trifolium repens]|nr:hypothetical protein QL285_009848 [Trifolium repens]
MPLHLSLRLCLVSCLWVLEIQGKNMVMLSFMSLGVGNSRLCLVSCLWVLEIQGKNMIMLSVMSLGVGKSNQKFRKGTQSNLEQENLEMCESFLLRSNVNFILMLSPFLNCKAST